MNEQLIKEAERLVSKIAQTRDDLKRLEERLHATRCALWRLVPGQTVVMARHKDRSARALVRVVSALDSRKPWISVSFERRDGTWSGQHIYVRAEWEHIR